MQVLGKQQTNALSLNKEERTKYIPKSKYPPPPMAQLPLLSQGLLIIEASRSHSGKPYFLGLLCMSDRPDAQTSTLQHTALTRDTFMPPARFETKV
jgi:hypothetical protein